MASFIVLGAGNFGAATALALKRAHPDLDVVLVDNWPRNRGSNPRAASHDRSKIVRPDYASVIHTRIMLAAMKKWRKDPLYAPFFHQTGMIRCDAGSFNDGCIASYEALGEEVPSRFISVDDARRRWGGVLSQANFRGVNQVYFNPNAGWADAENALNAVIEKALDLGVRYLEGDVHRLLIDPCGSCTGVAFASGETLPASNVVLCTGARTALLLANSAPDDKNIHAGGRLVATGAVCYAAEVEQGVRHKYMCAPVVKNGLDHTTGEVIPLDHNGVLKSNFEMSFTHITWHKASKQKISVPPGIDSEALWCSNVPETLKRSARQVVLNTYGAEIDGIVSETWRICWDATTPSHNFIISPHTGCKNLYIATGGSFHGWKFLPVIGDFVVQMIDGSLEEELAQLWSWDEAGRSRGGPKANHTYQIKKDLRDVEGWKELMMG